MAGDQPVHGFVEVVLVGAGEIEEFTQTAGGSIEAERAAYHLGNRHVALELGSGYLRLSPDSVLAQMLTQLGLTVVEEIAPLQPEAGAYAGHAHHPDQSRVPFRRHS